MSMTSSPAAPRFKLAVQNPSSHVRRGCVVTPWGPIAQKTGIPTPELVLRHDWGPPLRAQVDEIDPDDHSRDALSFILDDGVPPGADDYSLNSTFLTLERGEPAGEPGPEVIVVGPQGLEEGFKLVNDSLQIGFSLLPQPWGDLRNWYAGSAISVVYLGKEILDPFLAEITWQEHDSEKRCMQIDRIRLPRPAWEPEGWQEETLFGKPYRLLHHSHGPVRACATVASAPFDYDFVNPLTGRLGGLECRLYRVLSLFHQADYVIEELYVKGVPKDAPGASPVDLSFTARYFAYMDIGWFPAITHLAQIPDWFAIGSNEPPFPGYGFATDVHAAPVANPHPSYSDAEKRHKSFSWEIGMSRGAQCLHLFERGLRPGPLADSAGRKWYDYVYKPLRAMLLG